MKYNLLNTNTKLEKLNGVKYHIAGLTLAPHGIGGDNVCSHATDGCRSACVLWFSGRTVMQPTRDAMLRRKRLFFDDRNTFEDLLCDDIERHIKVARRRKLVPALRLNVASDLDWFHIARAFPEAKFYDYTKVRTRLHRKDLPSNYELTFSISERSRWNTARAYLARDRNVAAVFSTRYHPQSGRIDALPKHHTIGQRSYEVVDGDKHDVRLREQDGFGVIVGLRFKGSLKRRTRAIKQGFCIDVTN